MLIFKELKIHTNYLKIGRTCISERTARSTTRTTVATTRNFSTFLLLRYISPPPPKAGDKPPSGACNRITATSATEMMICSTEMTFPIIAILYMFSHYLCKLCGVMVERKCFINEISCHKPVCGIFIVLHSDIGVIKL